MDENDKEKREVGPFGSIELPSVEVTALGLKCRFPMADVEGMSVAVLLSQSGYSSENPAVYFGLLLAQAPNNMFQDPVRKTYFVSWMFDNGASSFRLADLGNDLYNLKLRGKTFKATWRDVYIRTSPGREDKADPANSLLTFSPDRFDGVVPFRVPRWLVGAMMSLGLNPLSQRTPTYTAVSFCHPHYPESANLVFGLCEKKPRDDGSPQHWARATPQPGVYAFDGYMWESQDHDCATDHVETWGPARTRDFGDAERTIRVTFTPCRLEPRTTLVLHVELRGDAYEDLQRSANFFIPPYGADMSRSYAGPRPSDARNQSSAGGSVVLSTRLKRLVRAMFCSPSSVPLDESIDTRVTGRQSRHGSKVSVAAVSETINMRGDSPLPPPPPPPQRSLSWTAETGMLPQTRSAIATDVPAQSSSVATHPDASQMPLSGTSRRWGAARVTRAERFLQGSTADPLLALAGQTRRLHRRWSRSGRRRGASRRRPRVRVQRMKAVL